jgi:hypothetical protein
MKLHTLFYRSCILVFLLTAAVPGFAQIEKGQQDPSVLLIGATLQELISRNGVPKQVYAVRGVESWQDDVVFVYDDIECFIFGNRVWQIKIRAAYNIKDGDTRAAVIRTLGEGRDFDGYTLYQLPARTWPLFLRINWNAQGKAAGLYIYRSDF